MFVTAAAHYVFNVILLIYQWRGIVDHCAWCPALGLATFKGIMALT